MNIHLGKVIYTSKDSSLHLRMVNMMYDGDRFWSTPECLIHGNTIKCRIQKRLQRRARAAEQWGDLEWGHLVDCNSRTNIHRVKVICTQRFWRCQNVVRGNTIVQESRYEVCCILEAPTIVTRFYLH
ncbi:uncharacterized protein LOC109012709 isoform X5 [Juglans regia]|uniref:Uncharacterized protein LOC109012709 isoform X5 n=1 Tax=Juglans regia TaxID=51240 RepID=A0A2I4H1M5_JUGRE|nr:uncharacterized protein LOC109012709 isoform X5 [Juglans regia]